MVVAAHAGAFFLHNDFLRRAFHFGGYGVELFFVLSGFLIGTILLRAFRKEFGVNELRYFWMRRWLRTIPAYYAALAFAFWSKEAFDPSYLILIQVPVTGNSSILPVAWSLAIEEWFYLLFPLACMV